MTKYYYLIYQITNELNKMIYIGAHITKNINDRYMGSGVRLHEDMKKIGMEHFTKSILFVFDNKKEMLDKERELVNSVFIKRTDTYNVILGGGTFFTKDLVTVRDKNGKCFDVHVDDERYKSGELKHIMKGLTLIRDENGNIKSIPSNSYVRNKHDYMFKNKVNVKDSFGKKFTVDINDQRYLNGELVGCTKNLVPVKNSKNEKFLVDINDSRYLNGELIHIWKNKKHNEETKKRIGAKNSISQKGGKNSQYGTCWIYNETLKISKKIKKNSFDQHLENEGWKIGRKFFKK